MNSLLGYSTPKILQNTVFLCGHQFCSQRSRGATQPTSLTICNTTYFPHNLFVHHDSSVFYEYTELFLKNNQHRFKDNNSKNKTCHGYALPGNDQCFLDRYLTLLPPNAPLYFYMHVLDRFSTDTNKKAATKQRVGSYIFVEEDAPRDIWTIRNWCKVYQPLTSCYSNYPNVYLWNFLIIIADTSGHKSTKALRCYEHKLEWLQQEVTAVINNVHVLSLNTTCPLILTGSQTEDTCESVLYWENKAIKHC